MKNNKLTRAKKQQFVKTADGTEVLKSKESRQKVRRWTFQAVISVVLQGKPTEDGTPSEDITMPERTLHLNTVHYGSAHEARQEAKHQEESLRAINDLYKRSKLRVECVPHETVSNETMRQLLGYRDMSSLLDRALELSIEEAQRIITGATMGINFVERPAKEAEKDSEGNTTQAAVPAYGLTQIKEHFYGEAVKEKTRELKQSGALDEVGDGGKVPQDEANAESEAEEEKPAFVPEIVEVQRAPRVPEDATVSDGIVEPAGVVG